MLNPKHFRRFVIIPALATLPEPMRTPAADDIEGLANTWKRFWNTVAGAGTTETFIKAYTPWAPKRAAGEVV